MVKQINTLKNPTSALRLSVVMCTLLFALGGCRQDYSLSPPANSEQVTVIVKVPEELAIETLEVMYRSATCKRAYRGASGQQLEEDGFHSFDRQLERQGQSDLYQASLPLDGGGACRWRLSNLMFGVAYSDPSHFGENVSRGAGAGILVKFDHNRSMRGVGLPIEVDGNLTIKKDYYPWVHERFLSGYSKTVDLAGEGHIYLNFRALRARQIYFEPIFHSGFVVSSEGVKEKREGNFIKFTYPDGSVVADGRTKPDFLKLQTLRTGRARECFSIIRYYKCPDRRPQLLPEWLPDPDKPGFGRYFIADEWGNELPRYHYRLLGKSGQSFQGRTDPSGRTQPLPDSAHPPLEVQFPERKW